MPILGSAQLRSELRPYVRAYAYRKFEMTDLVTVAPVPAQLEQVLNFELGILPGVRHRNKNVSTEVWIGGAQTSFPGYMELRPGVESFAIFFQPAGWSQLFSIPMSCSNSTVPSAFQGSPIESPWDCGNSREDSNRRQALHRKALRGWPAFKLPSTRSAPHT